MKAKDVTGQPPGGQRTKLIDILPLDTPLVVSVFPWYGCNLRCNYCMMSIPRKERHFVSSKIGMDLDLYRKCVKDMKKFKSKIKTLRFVGIGEPLIHPDIVKMVGITKEADIAERIEIITNGLMLTTKLNWNLISAGLNRLVISVQGISRKDYKRVTGCEIDFDSFVRDIKIFYQLRNKCHVYIKVADSVFQNDKDKQRFFNIFGDICDTIGIESTVPIQKGLDLPERETTQFGVPIKPIKICPQPFSYLQINPDGKVVPCYSFEYPYIMGDANHESIVDIWNGEKYKQFRKNNIDGILNMVCQNCQIIKYRIFPEDNLDHHAEQLKEIYA